MKEMKVLRNRLIVLVRHGLAEERDGVRPDHERALTSEGHVRMKAAAQGLAVIVPRVDLIVTSPLVRAAQTAQWLVRAWRGRVDMIEHDALEPGAGVEAVDELLAERRERRIVLVGHEPGLTEACLHLTGIPETEALGLRKGGCYGIRITSGHATLESVLPPRILRKLSR